MKHSCLSLIALLFAAGSAHAAQITITAVPAPTYYVAAAGSDSANGLSPATAWQSIAHVNAQTFAANTSVLFNGGDTFTTTAGIDLTTSVTSGTIKIGSYGTGQPTISSGNSAPCVIATDVPSVTVDNLICTGGGNTSNTTYGIVITNDQAGNTKLAGPTITNNTVTGYGSNGIFVYGSNGNSGFSDTTINGNTVHDVTGKDTTSNGTACIYVRGSAASFPGPGSAHTNVNLNGNTVYNCTGVSGNHTGQGSGFGITIASTTGGTIQNNVAHDVGANNGTTAGGPVGIWTFDSLDLTFQFNESYSNHAGGSSGSDGDGFDADTGSQGIIFQYNYAHDNDGAGFESAALDDGSTWQNNTFRFNISQNNGSAGQEGEFTILPDAGATAANVQIYNNTCYNNSSSSAGLCISNAFSGLTGTATGTIANNIFYAPNGASEPVIKFVSGMTVSGLTFAGDDYYTGGAVKFSWLGTSYSSYSAWQTATGQEKIGGVNVGLTSDPLLNSPGSGGTNGGYVPADLTGYQLMMGSPVAAGAGVNLTTNYSISPGTQDYFGTAVTATTLPIGAAAQ